MTRRGSRDPRARRRLGPLLAAQALVVAAVVAYAVTGPLRPDHGLQQLDLPSLHERVAGLAATGQPTLVVAAGTGSSCTAAVVEAGRRRNRSGGLPDSYPLIVYGNDLPAVPGITVRPDPGGALARALALPKAARGCHAGYAVLDRQGYVRYRTYDSGWAHHGGEESVLLGSYA